MSGTRLAGSYRAVLRRPAVARTFTLALLGRLAYGMLPLSLLFTIQHATGSFADAATGMALNGFAALSMPLKSRAIDRHGQRLVLSLITGCAVVTLGAGTSLAVSGVTAAPAWWATALVIGLASPPLGPSMRAQWRALVPDHDRTSAYSLDAVAEETLYLIGPMVAAAVLTVAPAYAGLPMAAALLSIGSLGLALSPAETRTGHPGHQRSRRGPLRRRRFLGLLVVMATAGGVTASIYTVTAARALAVGHPAYAGLADAGVAVGSVVGGLMWGRLQPTWPWVRSLTWLLAFLGSALLLAGACTGFGLFAGALAIAGLAIAPIYIVAYQASDALTDPTEVTEASTWVNTVTNLGISLGTAGAAFLVDHGGARAPGWAGAALALAVAGILASLTFPPSKPRSRGRTVRDAGSAA